MNIIKIKNIFDMHNKDSRDIENYINKPIVDVTITSPPYFNLKDYGYDQQIGYGQSYEEYLKDIKKVFQQVFNITKDTGSLWIVIDTFKDKIKGKIIPLPFDVVKELDSIGWVLNDIIIWNKDKTLPWSRKGQTKNKFEYVLFFVKNAKKFKYYSDRIRQYDTKHLKKWWVRYPERYNPRGKSAEEVWNYPLPTQGSWGKGYVKHFCPLPTDMIGNVIQLTSDENDVILDPFAGTGSVLIQAAYMKRKYIGFELNKDYIKRFKNYLKDTFKEGSRNYNLLKKEKYHQNNFEETILNLRALKFAKVFRNKLEKDERNLIRSIYANVLNKEPSQIHKLIKVNYNILIDTKNTLIKSEEDISKLKQQIINQVEQTPLSKFGVEPVLNYFFDKNEFIKNFEDSINYNYTQKVTHNYDSIFDGSIKNFSIISPIKVELNEKEFE